MYVSVYVPVRARFFMHSVAPVCLVRNEKQIFILFPGEGEGGGRGGKETSPTRNTNFSSFFFHHDVRVCT